MAFRNLTPLEIRDLISKYQSDLRKLQFQTHKVNQIILELQNYASSAEEPYAIEEPQLRELPSASSANKDTATTDSATAAPAKQQRKTRKGTGVKPPSSRGPGRPKKKRGPGRPPKAKKKSTPKQEKGKGYRLSEWDLFVMNSLDKESKALITGDFVELAKADDSIKLGPTDIKIKLNRSLHKLANKKGLLVKVEYDGRGYAYAKQEWLNSKGDLPKKYAR